MKKRRNMDGEILLAFDTSTDYLTMALASGDALLAHFHERVGRNHSSLLIPTLDKVLKGASLGIGDVDIFCVGIGPGSFTGLRIGVATAKGLACGTGKPIVATSTLDLIAQNVSGHKGMVCVVCDARKGNIYACFYKSNGVVAKKVSGYLLLKPEDLMKMAQKYEDIVFVGDALNLIGKSCEDAIDWYPRAENLVRIGLALARCGRYTPLEKLEPLYLYSKECDIRGI